MAHPMARKSNNFHVRLTEIVWKIRRQDVMEEIARLLGVEVANVSTSTAEWFTTRTTATKNVLEKMTPEDRAELLREKERIENQGYSEEYQQRCVLFYLMLLMPMPKSEKLLRLISKKLSRP